MTLCCSLCFQAELHTGTLPQIQSTALRGEKLHRIFHYVLDNLVNVMNGYCLPEPYFSTKVLVTSRFRARAQRFQFERRLVSLHVTARGPSVRAGPPCPCQLEWLFFLRLQCQSHQRATGESPILTACACSFAPGSCV